MGSLEQVWKNWASKKAAYLAYAKGWEEKIKSFLDFCPERFNSSQSGELAGMPFSVKDNIAVKDFRLTCGSKLLQDLVSPYTATAVARLEAAGAGVIGKNNLDEFGMGSSTDNSALAQTHNPWDVSRVAGGSSGGSAAAVAAGLVPFSLGTDTGGSVRQPASFCGLYGFKPTYGAVSRFGLTAYASSLDVIGALSYDIDLIEKVFNLIKGLDPFDQTSVEYRVIPPRRIKKIAVLRELENLSPAVAKVYNRSLDSLKNLGFDLVEVTLSTLEYAVPVYYILAMAEASANLARFDGVRYGQRTVHATTPEELVRKSRGEGLGHEVKTRVMLGCYILRSGFQEQYYHQAQKVRRAICQELSSLFTSVDLLMMPVFPTPAFLHGDTSMSSFQQKLADQFTVTANLAGCPALAFPAGIEEGLPIGMQFLAPAFEERCLFDTARVYQKECPVEHCPGYSLDWSK